LIISSATGSPGLDQHQGLEDDHFRGSENLLVDRHVIPRLPDSPGAPAQMKSVTLRLAPLQLFMNSNKKSAQLVDEVFHPKVTLRKVQR
jgi:hypothetical protein